MCSLFFVLNFVVSVSRAALAVPRLTHAQIGNNLKYWPDDHEVVSKTLQLFLDMASGYSSSKMLLGLDTVKFLMRNHTEEFFPFLVRFFHVGGGWRHRTDGMGPAGGSGPRQFDRDFFLILLHEYCSIAACFFLHAWCVSDVCFYVVLNRGTTAV